MRDHTDEITLYMHNFIVHPPLFRTFITFMVVLI